jgi:NADP-dependent 3-hydroxy acid dehydrogenase YdfG
MTTMLDRFRLDDKVAIVTGASSGLGVAFAKALAEAGADLVLAARRAERLEATREVIERTGRRVITVAADVAVPENVEAVTEAAMKEFGRVDVLVNNAGKGRRRRRHDTAENRPAPAVKISAAPASLPAGDALELPGRARLVLRRS